MEHTGRIARTQGEHRTSVAVHEPAPHRPGQHRDQAGRCRRSIPDRSRYRRARRNGQLGFDSPQRSCTRPATEHERPRRAGIRHRSRQPRVRAPLGRPRPDVRGCGAERASRRTKRSGRTPRPRSVTRRRLPDSAPRRILGFTLRHRGGPWAARRGADEHRRPRATNARPRSVGTALEGRPNAAPNDLSGR